MSQENQPHVVRCPEPFSPLFREAERRMAGFFEEIQREPEKGQLTIRGSRYLLMRADSFRFELHDELRKTFGEAGARQVAHKIAWWFCSALQGKIRRCLMMPYHVRSGR